MLRRWHPVLPALIVALVVCGCERAAVHDVGSSRTASAPLSPGRTPASKPVVELWNGGIYLAGIKPFVLFAAWEDGTILVRGNLRGSSQPAQDDEVRVGKASRDDINRLLKTCEKAGFFRPPIKGPLLNPDGPQFTIVVRARQREGRLSYHGGDPRLDEIGPAASPSRAQMEAFNRLWRAIEAAIRNVPVNDPVPYRGELPLLTP